MKTWNTDFKGISTFDVSLQLALGSVSEPWVLKEKQSSYCSSARAGKTTTALFTRRLQFTSWQTFHFQFASNGKILRREKSIQPHDQIPFCNRIPLSKTHTAPCLFGLFLVLNRARLQRVSLQAPSRAAFTISWPLGNLPLLVFIPHRRGHPPPPLLLTLQGNDSFHQHLG